METQTLQPDVDIQDVFADEAVINYASTDNSHAFMLAEEILGRQRDQIWEDTELFEVNLSEQDGQMIMILAKGRSDYETLLLKYFINEDPDEANVLYRQPVLSIYEDDISEEMMQEEYGDKEIDNS